MFVVGGEAIEFTFNFGVEIVDHHGGEVVANYEIYVLICFKIRRKGNNLVVYCIVPCCVIFVYSLLDLALTVVQVINSSLHKGIVIDFAA